MAYYLIDSYRALSGPVVIPVTPGLGVSLPSNAIELPDELTEPPAGFAWALVEDVPTLLADQRGPLYSTATGVKMVWSELGDIPEGMTLVPWPGQFYVWGDGEWRLDEAAQLSALSVEVLSERDARLRHAATRIAPLQYAVDLNDATEQEAALLLSWKRYSVELNRIEQQSAYPLNVNWPSAPDNTIKPL